MKFEITNKASSSADSFVYLTTRGCTQPLIRRLDEQTDGQLSKLAKKKSNLESLGAGWNLLAKGRPLFVCGLGDNQELSSLNFIRLMNKQAGQLKSCSASSLQIFVDEVSLKGVDHKGLFRRLGLAIATALYAFDIYKSKPKKNPSYHITFVTQHIPDDAIRLCRELEAVVAGCFWAQDLANMPGNECTPPYLARQARKLARASSSLRCTILGEKQLQKLGMNAYLAVSRGSKQPPQFILLEYRGGKAKDAPIVLLGKGMTFDTGGISIKPSAAMDEMKYDMCGAASVLGTMKAISILRPRVNLIGAVAAAENMPDANAYRPGDIIKTMDGKTVEVLNTDAEGRMVLCDALTYVRKYKPRYVLDVATLTGACVIALGHLRSGFFANNDDLAGDVERAAEEYHDQVWRLPLDEEYMEDMKSNFADIAHIGNRAAGTITAACFLKTFVKDYAWGHLDIAGTAWRSGAYKGATGRPVPLLTKFVLNNAN